MALTPMDSRDNDRRAVERMHAQQSHALFAVIVLLAVGGLVGNFVLDATTFKNHLFLGTIGLVGWLGLTTFAMTLSVVARAESQRLTLAFMRRWEESPFR